MPPRQTSKPKTGKTTDKPVAAYLGLTEDRAQQALIQARGDIFVASQLLEITALRLNRAIQVSPMLQATVDGIAKVGKGASEESIQEAIDSRIALYRVTGLDALHDLAAMPLDKEDNSAWGQVKLSAASRLAGAVEGMGGSGLEETLRELNKSYQDNAPRLRVIRERTTIETIPQERVVSEQGPQD